MWIFIHQPICIHGWWYFGQVLTDHPGHSDEHLYWQLWLKYIPLTLKMLSEIFSLSEISSLAQRFPSLRLVYCLTLNPSHCLPSSPSDGILFLSPHPHQSGPPSIYKIWFIVIILFPYTLLTSLFYHTCPCQLVYLFLSPPFPDQTCPISSLTLPLVNVSP